METLGNNCILNSWSKKPQISKEGWFSPTCSFHKCETLKNLRTGQSEILRKKKKREELNRETETKQTQCRNIWKTFVSECTVLKHIFSW